LRLIPTARDSDSQPSRLRGLFLRKQEAGIYGNPENPHRRIPLSLESMRVRAGGITRPAGRGVGRPFDPAQSSLPYLLQAAVYVKLAQASGQSRQLALQHDALMSVD